MIVNLHRTGPNTEFARVLGASITCGYFVVKELDETRKQLFVGIGLWWITIRIILWREK
jgi:hypothetical protein